MTTTITIAKNGASRSIVALYPVAAVQGLHHLQFSSQWSCAKNPDELVRQFGVSVDISDLRALHAWLGTYLQVNADPVVEHLPADDTEGGAA